MLNDLATVEFSMIGLERDKLNVSKVISCVIK